MNVYNLGPVSVKSELTTMHATRYTRRIMRNLAFSFALLVPLAYPNIRAEIRQDLIDLYRPALNDLLRGDERAKST